MRTIPLNPIEKGYETIVDDDDYEIVNQWRWSAQILDGRIYAYRTTKSRYRPGTKSQIDHKIRLHRFLIEAPDNVLVDHVNGNGLDNRRENLRLCTHSQNQQNSRKGQGRKHRYKGVSWHPIRQRWQARIRVDGRIVSLRYHDTEEEAARAYNEAATKYFGSFARLNILPDNGDSSYPSDEGG